jgi:hypothetical protein
LWLDCRFAAAPAVSLPGELVVVLGWYGLIQLVELITDLVAAPLPEAASETMII